MSVAILKRNDSKHLLNSYVRVYKTFKLYKMKTDYRKTILRIVKKSILGTNFIYYYSKQNFFISSIFNIVIINLNFLLFPQLLYNSKSFIDYSEERSDQSQFQAHKILNFNKTFYIIFRLFIINLADIIIFSIIIIHYKYKKKQINKYMEKYTQCSIERENKLINKYYHCTISKDGKFSIEINTIKNKNNKEYKNNKKINSKNNYFFEYVINFPNIRFLSHYAYKKIFLPKEKEIINKIVAISNEIEYKYKKKLLTFLLIIISIIIYIPLNNFFSEEKKTDFINYFGILILIVFVERNNFFKNKNEQIKRVSLLNNEYINDGYYIYINNDVISIFFVKEQFRNAEFLGKIKEMNEKLLYKLDLI